MVACMKKWIFVFSLAGFLVNVGFAQLPQRLVYHSEIEKGALSTFLKSDSYNKLTLQLMSDPLVDQQELKVFQRDIHNYVELLKAKRHKMPSDKAFYGYVFYKTHHKLLKRYKKYSEFSTLLRTGVYNCLSATTLYALLYDALGVDIEIIETNHHIYLQLNTLNETFLVESTDPINGFIENEEEIEAKLKPSFQQRGEDQLFKFSFDLNERIGLDKLAGLQYYNKAVHAFNKGEIIAAIELMEKASVFYNNKRLREFGILLGKVLIADQSIESSIRSHYLERIGATTRVQFIIASI